MQPHTPDPAVFSTDVVGPRERFAYWREAVCEAFVQLDCERVGRDPFAGAITTRPFGALQLSEVAGGPQHVIRTRRQIARACKADLFVPLQLDGQGAISQDGRTAVLRVGDFCLKDSARPFTLHFDGTFRQLVVQIPRERLAERLGRPETFTGIRIGGDDPVGHLASEFLVTLARESRPIPAAAAERLSGIALDLLATAFATAQGAAVTTRTRRSAALAHAKMLTLARLDNVALKPAMIAAAIAIAPRSLHRLFETEGTTFMRWVMEQRLSAAGRDLCDPLQCHRSVSDIALSRGFADLSHFSRAFRRRFGAAPRDFRAGVVALKAIE